MESVWGGGQETRTILRTKINKILTSAAVTEAGKIPLLVKFYNTSADSAVCWSIVVLHYLGRRKEHRPEFCFEDLLHPFQRELQLKPPKLSNTVVATALISPPNFILTISLFSGDRYTYNRWFWIPQAIIFRIKESDWRYL